MFVTASACIIFLPALPVTLLLLLKLKERAGNSVPDKVGKQEEQVLGLYQNPGLHHQGRDRVQSGDLLSRSQLAMHSQGHVFASEQEKILALLSDLS